MYVIGGRPKAARAEESRVSSIRQGACRSAKQQKRPPVWIEVDIMYYQHIGHYISELRHTEHIKQSELAKLLNCTQQLISLYEHGKTKPTINGFTQLHKLLLSKDKIHDDWYYLRVYGRSKPGTRCDTENSRVR